MSRCKRMGSVERRPMAAWPPASSKPMTTSGVTSRTSPNQHKEVLRRALAALVAVVLVSVTAPTSFADSGSAGGKNVVIAINETDGSVLPRSGVAVTVAAANTVGSENLASARSSCTDCRTVAVAMQAVLITRDPSTVSPKNIAVALNDDCLRCQTFADAYQYVVSTGGPAHLSDEGRQRVADLRGRVADTAASGLAFDQLEAELDALYAEFKDVIDTDLVRNGGTPRGTTAKDVKAAP